MSIEKRPLILHRYIAEYDSPEVMTSYYKIRFVKGEYYHAARYYGIDGILDDMHCVVMGVFDVKGERMEIKPFVLRIDCKKYLTHRP